MTEILTESFCERCGTRYTFQTAAPRRARMGKLKVLSKGLTNWVQSDDSSLEEALADARSEVDRAVSSHQLEAFHQTFNFCMSCRQYTCANCWNGPENRCLTCAPDLSREILPAPFPEIEQHAPLVLGTAHLAGSGEAHESHEPGPEAWPEVDIGRLAAVMGATNGVDEHSADEIRTEPAIEEAGAIPEATTPERPVIEPPLRRRPLVAPRSSVAASHDEEQAAQAAEDAAAAAALPEVVPVDALQPVATVVEPAGVEVERAGAEPEPAGAEPEPAGEPEPAVTAMPSEADSSTDARAAAAAAQTAAMLRRFRPGQSIDAELEAYEREAYEREAQRAVDERAAAAAAAAALAATPTRAPEQEPVASVEPEPEPVAAAEPEPVAAAPEPETPPARRDDRVEIPTWRIVAPDGPGDETPVPAPVMPPAKPGAPQWPQAQQADPQWPQAPQNGTAQWPSAAAYLGAATAPAARAQAALWAASSAEVADKAGGIQSCTSCGLALSATARFCRRCGTRQG